MSLGHEPNAAKVPISVIPVAFRSIRCSATDEIAVRDMDLPRIASGAKLATKEREEV